MCVCVCVCVCVRVRVCMCVCIGLVFVPLFNGISTFVKYSIANPY